MTPPLWPDYAPQHDCPVCGRLVLNVRPFHADCPPCTLWAALILCGGAA